MQKRVNSYLIHHSTRNEYREHSSSYIGPQSLLSAQAKGQSRGTTIFFNLVVLAAILTGFCRFKLAKGEFRAPLQRFPAVLLVFEDSNLAISEFCPQLTRLKHRTREKKKWCSTA